MKTTELKKLIDGAEVELVDDRKKKTHRVYIKSLDREFFSEKKTQADAKAEVLDIIVNESDRVRGFELNDTWTEDNLKKA